MEEMTMQLPRPHNTPEKNALVPDMTDDNMNSIKVTDDQALNSKTPRSVLELYYKFLDSMRRWHITWSYYRRCMKVLRNKTISEMDSN
jgi:hypothetical protein